MYPVYTYLCIHVIYNEKPAAIALSHFEPAAATHNVHSEQGPCRLCTDTAPPAGAPASGDALPPSSTEAPSSGQEAASPAQAAKHVGVQTDLLLMHLPTPDAASATAGDQTEARNNASPVPAVLEGKQHLQAAGGKHQTTDASCGPDSCDSPHRRAAAGDASRGPESCASPCDRPAAADASCGPESYDSPGDVLGAADVADSSPQQQQAPSMHSSSGHRSNTQNAMRNSKAASANSDDDATQAQPGRDPAAMRRSQQGPEEVDGQRRVDVARQGGQPTGGQLLESRGKAKGEGEAEWSRGLQLPQKLSIASLARHAGVDRAFMQVITFPQQRSIRSPKSPMRLYVHPSIHSSKHSCIHASIHCLKLSNVVLLLELLVYACIHSSCIRPYICSQTSWWVSPPPTPAPSTTNSAKSPRPVCSEQLDTPSTHSVQGRQVQGCLHLV